MGIYCMIFKINKRKVVTISKNKIMFCHDKNGKTVRYSNVIVGEEYFCLHCGKELVVKCGDIRAKYLAHLHGEDTCVVNSRNYIHAKDKTKESCNNIGAEIDLKYEDMPPLVQQQIDLGLLTMNSIEKHLATHMKNRK